MSFLHIKFPKIYETSIGQTFRAGLPTKTGLRTPTPGGHLMAATLLDNRQAFDQVWPDRLPGYLINRIFLTKHFKHFQVRVGNVLSGARSIASGVTQHTQSSEF